MLKSHKMALFGCDTFIVLPPLTAHGDIIFGKNSDRPKGEVQEVLYYPSKTYKPNEKLQCTYIEIDQVPETHAILLSKPSWMWGAEMGANSCGVVIGNEAVWTVVNDDVETERLLGMDLLRLGLERASSSSEAVKTISALLEQYGQGGPCSDTDSGLFYHNSFLIADNKEAWVLETAGKLWAAERISSGHRNISNCLSIGANVTIHSDHLITFAKQHKLWQGQGKLNFKEVFSNGGCPREAAGCKLLNELTSDKKFDMERMFQILRDKKSGVCRPVDDPFHTSGSWTSSLNTSDFEKSCHWVTATPDPSVSIFKPFIFSPSPVIATSIISPTFDTDPAKNVPRFQFKVDRRHELYKLHEIASRKSMLQLKIKEVEQELLVHSYKILQTSQDSLRNTLLKNAVKREIELYSS